MSQTAAEVAEQVYARWNASGPSALTERVHPEVELICDPLRPAQSTLRGVEGARQWAARWNDSYADMHIALDGVVPMGDAHALALVSITATPRGGTHALCWAAAHLWTIRDGRVERWEPHVDLQAARRTLL